MEIDVSFPTTWVYDAAHLADAHSACTDAALVEKQFPKLASPWVDASHAPTRVSRAPGFSWYFSWPATAWQRGQRTSVQANGVPRACGAGAGGVAAPVDDASKINRNCSIMGIEATCVGGQSRRASVISNTVHQMA